MSAKKQAIEEKAIKEEVKVKRQEVRAKKRKEREEAQALKAAKAAENRELKAAKTAQVKAKKGKQSKKSNERETEHQPEMEENIRNDNEEEYFCIYCEEKYIEPPNEDWIACMRCHKWCHESCTGRKRKNMKCVRKLF